MKIVAIKDMSAGNEMVEEVWKETKIFDSEQPISDIIKWVNEDSYYNGWPLKKNVIITVAEESEESKQPNNWD